MLLVYPFLLSFWGWGGKPPKGSPSGAIWRQIRADRPWLTRSLRISRLDASISSRLPFISSAKPSESPTEKGPRQFHVLVPMDDYARRPPEVEIPSPFHLQGWGYSELNRLQPYSEVNRLSTLLFCWLKNAHLQMPTEYRHKLKTEAQLSFFRGLRDKEGFQVFGTPHDGSRQPPSALVNMVVFCC